jgi:hypothetical protein
VTDPTGGKTVAVPDVGVGVSVGIPTPPVVVGVGVSVGIPTPPVVVGVGVSVGPVPGSVGVEELAGAVGVGVSAGGGGWVGVGVPSSGHTGCEILNIPSQSTKIIADAPT